MPVIILDNKTIRGTLSSSDVITARGGNSNNWNSVYTEFNTQSANNASVYSLTNAKSAAWDLASSGSSSYVTWTQFNPFSAFWQSNYTTTNTNSANWRSVYSSFNNQSANNASVYSTFNTQSANNASVYSLTNAKSAAWDAASGAGSGYVTWTQFSPASAFWQSNYTTTNTNSANWQSVYSTFNTQSARNASVYSTFNTQSANNASVYSTFNTQSANNASVYSTVNTNSATWSGATAVNGVCVQGPFGCFIGGGCNNTLTGAYGTIVGGDTNTLINAANSFIGGGSYNRNSGSSSNIVGGRSNCIPTAANFTSIVGGRCNTASGIYSFVAGGSGNDTKSYNCAFILGVNLSANQANFTYVNNLSSQSGIVSNTLNANLVTGSTISSLGALSGTSIRSTGPIQGTTITGSTISSLGALSGTSICSSGTISAPSLSASGSICSTGSGFYGNGSNITGMPFFSVDNNNFSCQGAHNLDVGPNLDYGPSAIISGYSNTMGSRNASTIAAGQYNNVSFDSEASFIGAGNRNILTTSGGSSIMNGQANCITGSLISTIVAGSSGCILDNSQYAAILNGNCTHICRSPGSSIVGGLNNCIRNTGVFTQGQNNVVIGGGQNSASGYNINSATVIGGVSNCVSSNSSIIAGGGANCIWSNNVQSAIIGGFNNRIGTSSPTLTAWRSFIGGGLDNCVAAYYSTAFGTGASATRYNEFAIGYNTVKAGSQFSIIQLDGILTVAGNNGIGFGDGTSLVIPLNSTSLIEWDIVTTTTNGASATAQKWISLIRNNANIITHVTGTLTNTLNTNVGALFSNFGYSFINPTSNILPVVVTTVANVRAKLTGKISQLFY